MTRKDQPAQEPDSDHFVDSDVVGDLRVRGAFVRTAMSSEQSLMSWIRTSVSMYTFGFSITQFFFYIADRQGATQLAVGPRILGLALVTTGVVAILLGATEHVLRIRTMRKEGLPPNVQFFLPLGSAIAFLLVGLVALVAIYLNWHF